IAVIRMDDGKANALSPAVVVGLDEAFSRAEADADVKAVVLAGRPGKFSAGFDLKVMMSGPQAARDLVMAGGGFFMRLYAFPKPVVAAVSGHAIAGGVLLAASCDVRIGIAGDFKLGLNEVQAGMPVPILAHKLARDRLDPRHLTEAVLFSRLYDPEAAKDVGWLDLVVDGSDLEAEAMKVAGQLSQLPAGPYARTKESLRRETIAYVLATVEEDIASFAS
ncbi:MAG: crotonase/enoyl-CoA hydratase family protein, partial [Deltaproteobacteria bacterium]|nr:crotonase/enoyl-CoA hydratase family protein [Deltaproteobacteria bacterium]